VTATVEPGVAARRLALQALAKIDDGGFANIILGPLLEESGLETRDRALVSELVYGTTRMRSALDFLIDRHVLEPPDPSGRNALRLGAYQLRYLRVPAHAAVSASVAASPKRLRGFVNAVLRKIAAEDPPPWPDMATELSYPQWIVDLFVSEFGEVDAEAALRWMNQAATVDTRNDGYIQNRASQWVAAEVAAQPGELVVDLCAAPGGKATALAALGARVIAIDLNPARVAQMHANIVKLGLPEPGAALASAESSAPGLASSETPASEPSTSEPSASKRRSVEPSGSEPRCAGPSTSESPPSDPPAPDSGSSRLPATVAVVADGRSTPLRAGCADRVLVDAPCSGLGVLQRRPDARWRIDAASLVRLPDLQFALIEEAIRLCRPGGVVAYSVCTLSSAETSEVARRVSAAHPELSLLDPPNDPWHAIDGGGGRLLPHEAEADGMALFQWRRAEAG